MGFRKKEKKKIFHQKSNEKEQNNSEKNLFYSKYHLGFIKRLARS